VHTARGRARIEQRSDGAGELVFRYDPTPDDALGYLDTEARRAFVNAGYHSAERWLAMTAASDYPDVVPQLGPLLKHPRGGDVLLFAAPGWCFVPQRGGHGGLRAGEMTATFAVAGPQFPPGTRLDYARTLDLAATILDLLGAPLPADWPSRSLRQRLGEQEAQRSSRDPFAVENWLTAGFRPR
jgi:arylsulfatase A-like enzyme